MRPDVMALAKTLSDDSFNRFMGRWALCVPSPLLQLTVSYHKRSVLPKGRALCARPRRQSASRFRYKLGGAKAPENKAGSPVCDGFSPLLLHFPTWGGNSLGDSNPVGKFQPIGSRYFFIYPGGGGKSALLFFCLLFSRYLI